MNRLYVILQIISFTFGNPHTEDTYVTLVVFFFLDWRGTKGSGQGGTGFS